MEAEALRNTVATSKRMVVVAIVAVGLVELARPGSTYIFISGPILAMHLGFYMWCERSGDEALHLLSSHTGWLTIFSSAAFLHNVRLSDGEFVSGIAHYWLPLAMGRESNSTVQGTCGLLVYFAALVYKSLSDHMENVQRLGVALVILYHAIEIMRNTSKLRDAHERSNAGLDLIIGILSFMTDGCMVTNAQGQVLVMDKRAASLLGGDQMTLVQHGKNGLSSAKFQTTRGECFQAEVYTSPVVSIMSRRALSVVFGIDHAKLENMQNRSEQLFFSCFRVVQQYAGLQMAAVPGNEAAATTPHTQDFAHHSKPMVAALRCYSRKQPETGSVAELGPTVPSDADMDRESSSSASSWDSHSLTAQQSEENGHVQSVLIAVDTGSDNLIVKQITLNFYSDEDVASTGYSIVQPCLKDWLGEAEIDAVAEWICENVNRAAYGSTENATGYGTLCLRCGGDVFIKAGGVALEVPELDGQHGEQNCGNEMRNVELPIVILRLGEILKVRWPPWFRGRRPRKQRDQQSYRAEFRALQRVEEY